MLVAPTQLISLWTRTEPARFEKKRHCLRPSAPRPDPGSNRTRPRMPRSSRVPRPRPTSAGKGHERRPAARSRRVPRTWLTQRQVERDDERRRTAAAKFENEKHERKLRTLRGLRLRLYCEEHGVPVPAMGKAALADSDVTLEDLFGAPSDEEMHEPAAPPDSRKLVARAGGADDDDVALEELFDDVEQHANERRYDSNSEEVF